MLQVYLPEKMPNLVTAKNGLGAHCSRPSSSPPTPVKRLRARCFPSCRLDRFLNGLVEEKINARKISIEHFDLYYSEITNISDLLEDIRIQLVEGFAVDCVWRWICPAFGKASARHWLHSQRPLLLKTLAIIRATPLNHSQTSAERQTPGGLPRRESL